MFKLMIEKNVQIKTMEEKIEKFLKEKEKFTQLVIAPIISIPITLSRTASTSITVESTSTIGDLNKLLQELTHQKQENERLHKNFKNLEA